MINILFPAIFIVVFMVALSFGSLSFFMIAIGSAALSLVVYFFLGINVPGCERFHSMPFGGCSYAEEIIMTNVSFWFCIIFVIFFLIRMIKKRINKKEEKIENANEVKSLKN